MSLDDIKNLQETLFMAEVERKIYDDKELLLQRLAQRIESSGGNSTQLGNLRQQLIEDQKNAERRLMDLYSRVRLEFTPRYVEGHSQPETPTTNPTRIEKLHWDKLKVYQAGGVK